MAERQIAIDRAIKARGAQFDKSLGRRALASRIGGFGLRALGVIGGMLVPGKLDPSEATLEQIQGQIARDVLRPVEVTVQKLPKPVPRLRKPNVTTQSIDPAPLRPDLEQPAAPRPDPTPRAATTPSAVVSPGPARSAGKGSPVSSTRPGAPRTSIIPSVVNFSNIIEALVRRRGSSAAPSISTSSIVSSVSNTTSGPLTQSQPFAVPFGLSPPAGTSTQRTCEENCRRKKKKKSRKCLERAQVEWRTGRFKGKIAGTKCVRFAKG